MSEVNKKAVMYTISRVLLTIVIVFITCSVGIEMGWDAGGEEPYEIRKSR